MPIHSSEPLPKNLEGPASCPGDTADFSAVMWPRNPAPDVAGAGARQRSEPRVRVQPGPSDVKSLSVSPPSLRYRSMGCQFVELRKMTDSFRAVTPIRPAAAYIGGKRRLGEQLARRIEAVPHETYAEPFIGMGGVFFRRRWAPRREVVNDVSRDVATLFRILQRHYPQFMETLKFQMPRAPSSSASWRPIWTP